jgi:putative ABC transport system permease protein
MDPSLYAITLVAMVALSMLASAWVARRTVRKPIVDALAHV